MKNILDTIDRNYKNKLNEARDNLSEIELYLDEKIDRENGIKTALMGVLNQQEQKYIETLNIFFEIENKRLEETNLEDKQERELQIEGAKNDIIIDTRRYLISDTKNNFPILGIINGQKFREITSLLYEENYKENGIFDEELRLEENYFDKNYDEEQEENGEEKNDQNQENGPQRSGEATAMILSPFLNGIRWDIKEKYNVGRSEIGFGIKKNIAKFIEIFENKPKIFISVFAERYTQEECKYIIEKHYPKDYYRQSLNTYIDERYQEENN